VPDSYKSISILLRTNLPQKPLVLVEGGVKFDTDWHIARIANV